MKISTFALILGFVLATVTWTQVARAAGSDGTGFYVGGGAGVSRAKIDSAAINSSLLSIGAATASTKKDENSAAYKVFVGYAFNRYIAVEGGYFDLGTFKIDSTISPPGTLHGEIKPRGVNVDAVLSYPFADGFSVFVRGGVQNTKTKATFSGSGSLVVTTPESSETKTSWKAGLGAGYEFSSGVGLRAEWERYRVPDGSKSNQKADVDVFGLSLYYKF